MTRNQAIAICKNLNPHDVETIALAAQTLEISAANRNLTIGRREDLMALAADARAIDNS